MNYKYLHDNKLTKKNQLNKRSTKELKEEGKDLMKKDNNTVENFKKTLKDYNNNNDNTIYLNE